MDPANLLTKRHWIAELARRKPGAVLYSLNHVIDFEWMREAYLKTRKEGAPGIERVTDGGIRRIIDKWLKAGVREDGLLRLATEGTPQGGVISPMLSNIFLHHVLDEWFEKEVRPRMTGPCTLVRFADDFVMTFKNHHDAKRVMQAGHGGVGQAAWTVWAHAPSRQDARHPLPPRASRWHASGLRRAAVRLSRLHPHLDEVAEGQERGAPANGQKPARPRAGGDRRLVSEQPPPAAGGPAATADRQARRPLRLLRHHREHRATRPVLPSDRTAMAEMAGPTNAPACPGMGQVQRAPRTLSTPQASGHPSLRRAQRSSPVKNRKREICTSGTVGGEGGNILTYPAA